MFVCYVDLEQTGRAKPVPCQSIKPLTMFGSGWFKLVGVEQIKELARPTMKVTELIVQTQHIHYIIGGDDPSDLPPGALASTPKVEITKEQLAPIEESKATDATEPKEDKPQRKRVGRPKGSKNKPKTQTSKK